MARTKGTKNISKQDREAMKYIIAPRLKYRDTNEELLIKLEDKGHNIGMAILLDLKKELRDGLKERFKQIGEYELAQEHDFAIGMMKDLMVKLQSQWSDPDQDKPRLSAEIRAIQRDLIDYYGSADIVENVFKYFNEEEKEEETKNVTKIRDRIKKKKPINKPKKHKMMSEF